MCLSRNEDKSQTSRFKVFLHMCNYNDLNYSKLFWNLDGSLLTSVNRILNTSL